MILTPLFVTLIFYIILQFDHHQFERSIQQTEHTFTAQKRTLLQEKVDNIAKLINTQQNMTKKTLKEKVKSRVDAAYAIASDIYRQNHQSKPAQDIQKMIVDALRPLVWNNGESFIFILDFNGTFHLAPAYLRDKEGTSIIDFQDATKRYVIREEIALAKEKGEGYLWDTFTRKGYPKEQQFKQLAFIKRLPGYDWYMGSAEYLDTTKKERIRSMLDILNAFPANKSEYFFILDHKGNVIKHTYDSHLEGKNVYNIKDTQNKYFVKEMIHQVENNGSTFLSYRWKDPQTGQTDTKYTYARIIPGTNWILASGFYKNMLDDAITKKRQSLTHTYYTELKQILIISVTLIVLSIILSYIVSKFLYRRFESFRHTIEHNNKALQELNHNLEEKVYLRTQELDSAYKKMKKLSHTDALTAISNRHFFEKTLEEMIKASRYPDKTFALLIFDLDHFKKINDTYGHDIGDTVLRQLTEKVKQLIGEDTVFARVGGEEFIILLPENDPDTIFNFAENIRKLISQASFTQVVRVTISIGYTIFQTGDTQHTLLKRADMALYQAKSKGRNRTEKK